MVCDPDVQTDAESRRNCLQALGRLATESAARDTQRKEERQDSSQPALLLIPVDGRPLYSIVLSACLVGCSDYATDNRGDVGSWVREAAMRTMGGVLNALTSLYHGNPLLLSLLPTRLLDQCVGALLQQAVEKIDRGRECAGQVLHSLVDRGSLTSTTDSPLLRATLLTGPRRIDWSSPGRHLPSVRSTAIVRVFPPFSLERPCRVSWWTD